MPPVVGEAREGFSRKNSAKAIYEQWWAVLTTICNVCRMENSLKSFNLKIDLTNPRTKTGYVIYWLTLDTANAGICKFFLDRKVHRLYLMSEFHFG